MITNVVAIIPAAGLGKRFGKGSNKAFATLRDKPLILWTLEVFESIDFIAEIVPVFKKEEMEAGRELIEGAGISKVKKIAAGGKERQDSVYSGLKLVGNKFDTILIHDGVRPLVERAVVEEAIKQLRDFDGVIVGVPVKDTVKEIISKYDEVLVKKTLKRDTLWAVQTPQVFKYSSLIRAYKKAMAEGFYSTDDSAIVEKYGGKVKAVMGSYTNIKITTPEDIYIAELFLKKRDKGI